MINYCQGVDLKHCNGSKAFVEYSNNRDDVYENISEYNPSKKHKILIVFDYLIADILTIKICNI